MFIKKSYQGGLLINSLAGLIAAVSVLSFAEPIQAAESVVLKYGFFKESVSIPDLSTFAETGELSPSLKAYFRMTNAEPQQVQEVLTRGIEVEPVALSKILNTLPGEYLLDGASEVIQTPTQSASRQSLRAALVSSALTDSNITLLEVLENYPTTDVHVEGERLLEVYTRLDRVLGTLSEVERLLGTLSELGIEVNQ